MVEKIISKKEDLEKIELEVEKKEAILAFIEEGRFVKLSGKKITYPKKEVLEKELKKLNERKIGLQSLLIKKNLELRKIKMKERFSGLMGVFQPLYIKHLYLYLKDVEYRKDFEKSRIPTKAFADKKTKKIIKEFMENNEFRKRFLETIENSPVYKDRMPLDYLDKSLDIIKTQVEKELKDVEKELKEVEKKIKCRKEIMKMM